MHLKSLELTGFKSFAEAKIEFPSGVTSVVGPNGTGKSNVVDAMLWVLGEQSAKTLRSERMEDVIFNGTEARKPLGMAEVSLVMADVDEERIKGLPALPHQLSEFHEVMITRRLYRNGDSEYLINKTPCRLKDVRGLFLDSRAGTKGHTIIEQGRIEQILNATPQDRRELIEETAGIVRYKKQKAEALRKLDSTQQNLLRVKDIITEVRRQLNSLERQARQARTFQHLQEEAKTLEVRLLACECRGLLSERTAIEAELSAVESQEAIHLADQGRLEGELETLKVGLLSRTEEVGRIRRDLGEVEQQQALAVTAMEVEKGRLALYEQQRISGQEELERLTAEAEQAALALQQLQDRLSADELEMERHTQVCAALEATEKELAARRVTAAAEEERARHALVTLTVQMTRAENAVSSLTAQSEQTCRRIDRLGQELSETESQQAAVMARFYGATSSREEQERTAHELRAQLSLKVDDTHRLEDEVRTNEETIRRQQETLAALDSRLKALQGVLREEMGYGREGDEEGSSLRAACTSVKESIAEWLTVPPGLERAVEAVLGERLHAWLISEPLESRRAIDFLNRQGLGRGAFVPVQPRYSSHADRSDAWWPALQGQSGVLGRATDLLRAETLSHDVLACLFENVVIVNSLDVAIEQWGRHLWSAPNGPTLVTIDGEVLDAAGVLTGGTAGSSGGLLLRRREVQRLEEERGDAVCSVDDSREQLQALLVLVQQGREAVQQLEHAIRQADMEILGLGKDEAACRQTVDELSQRVETIRRERALQEEERDRLLTELETTRNDLMLRTEDKARQETDFAALQDSLRAYEEESQALQLRSRESHLALAAVRAGREHAEADLRRVGREQAEMTVRIATLTEQLAILTTSVEQSRIERARNERLFTELDQRALQIRLDLQAAQARHDQDMQSADVLDRQLASVRRAVADSREQRMGIEVRRAEVATQLSVRESTLQGTYQLSLEAALVHDPEAEASALPHDQLPLREQLQKVRDRLDRLGPINLAAIEEHRELEERHRFLTTQEEDLSKSVASLKEIISRINRTTKDMFLETFNELQQKFIEVFARFFPGGRAELVLIAPEPDPDGEVGSDEPGVDIAAQPPGKRLKSITMLSGGEKTLTAMALIFASFLIRPTPFCILDEIDAPLDEENIGRFTAVLRELSGSAQFIVITHNKRTMAIADSLFGVTMEEPGVSKLISVRLADLQPV